MYQQIEHTQSFVRMRDQDKGGEVTIKKEIPLIQFLLSSDFEDEDSVDNDPEIMKEIEGSEKEGSCMEEEVSEFEEGENSDQDQERDEPNQEFDLNEKEEEEKEADSGDLSEHDQRRESEQDIEFAEKLVESQVRNNRNFTSNTYRDLYRKLDKALEEIFCEVTELVRDKCGPCPSSKGGKKIVSMDSGSEEEGKGERRKRTDRVQGRKQLKKVRQIGRTKSKQNDPLKKRNEDSEIRDSNNEGKILPCSSLNCHFVTLSQSELSSHMLSHKNTDSHLHLKSKSQKFCCYLCDYSTNVEKHYQSHTLNVHVHHLKSAVSRPEESYSCSQCDYVNLSKHNLRMHEVKHSKTKDFKCSMCDFETKFRHSLRRHAITHFRHILSPGISLQNKRLQKQNGNTKVLKKYHGENNTQIKKNATEDINSFKCSQCDYSSNFTSNVIKHNLRLHMGITYNGIRYKCSFCAFNCVKWSDMKMHQIKKHNSDFSRLYIQSGVRFKCPEANCDYSSNIKRNLNLHQLNIHMSSFGIRFRKPPNDKKYACSHCDYCTNFKFHFEKHQQSKHKHLEVESNTSKINLGAHKCSHCNYNTNIEHNLRIHMIQHNYKESKNNENENNVQLKTDVFQEDKGSEERMKSLKLHQEMDKIYVQPIYTGAKIKTHKCSVCDYASVHKPNVRKHLLVHLRKLSNFKKTEKNMEKSFNCPYCDHQSESKALLQYHKYTHTEDKKYKCDKCKYRTQYSENLSKHKLIHLQTNILNPKPFKCLFCNHRSETKRLLQFHKYTHTKDNKLKCDKCDYCAKYPSNLTQHKLIHLQTKVFKCSRCSTFTTNYKQALNIHTKKCQPL